MNRINLDEHGPKLSGKGIKHYHKHSVFLPAETNGGVTIDVFADVALIKNRHNELAYFYYKDLCINCWPFDLILFLSHRRDMGSMGGRALTSVEEEIFDFNAVNRMIALGGGSLTLNPAITDVEIVVSLSNYILAIKNYSGKNYFFKHCQDGFAFGINEKNQEHYSLFKYNRVTQEQSVINIDRDKYLKLAALEIKIDYYDNRLVCNYITAMLISRSSAIYDLLGFSS